MLSYVKNARKICTGRKNILSLPPETQNHYNMKRNILLLAIAACVLLGCSKAQEEPLQSVTFSVSNFAQSTSPIDGAAQAPASLIDGDDVLTDLYLFDGATQLIHQTSDAQDFGTITVMLSVGEHTLHFVATRSAGVTYADGVLYCTSLRNTFGKTITLNVAGGTNENVTLERIVGKLIITIEDEVPANAYNLRIQVGQLYHSLDVQTLYGVSPEPFDQTLTIVNKVGMTGSTWTLPILSPDADGYETSYTLTATDADGHTIGQATGNVTLAPNTKTNLHGSLFTGTRSFVQLNTSWNADIDASF